MSACEIGSQCGGKFWLKNHAYNIPDFTVNEHIVYIYNEIRYLKINLRLKYFLSLWVRSVKINSCTNLSQIVDADGRGHFISVHKHNIVGRSLHHDLHLQEMTDALVIPTTTTKQYQLRLSPSFSETDTIVICTITKSNQVCISCLLLSLSLSLSLTHTHT